MEIPAGEAACPGRRWILPGVRLTGSFIGGDREQQSSGKRQCLLKHKLHLHGGHSDSQLLLAAEQFFLCPRDPVLQRLLERILLLAQFFIGGVDQNMIQLSEDNVLKKTSFVFVYRIASNSAFIRSGIENFLLKFRY